MGIKKYISLIVLITVFITGCGTKKPTTTKITKVNTKIVRLGVYTGFDYKILDGFEKKSGYKLQITNLGTENEALQSVSSNNSKIDVVAGVNNYNYYMTDGIGQNYKTTTDIKETNKKIPIRQKDKVDTETSFSYNDKLFVPVESKIYNIKIDNKYFTKKKIKAPKNFNDILKKKYRKLFVIPNPLSTNAGMSFLYAIRAYFGSTKWVKYEKKLLTNSSLQIASNDATAKNMWSKNGGKYPITIGLQSQNKNTNVYKTAGLWTNYAMLVKENGINKIGGTALMNYFNKKFKAAKSPFAKPYNLEYSIGRGATKGLFELWKSI